MEKLLEPQIKALLINKLIETGKINRGDILVNEFTIDNSTRRVDLAVISDNHIEAFEIKSEADSLYRLEGQISKYLEYFDKVTIITASKHRRKIESSIKKNIGLWEIRENKLKVIQRGRKKEITQKNKTIDLMTALELKKLAKKIGINTTKHRRKDLEEILINASARLLKKHALEAIKTRYDSTYSVFHQSTLGRRITADDLKLLSPRKTNLIVKNDTSLDSIISSLESI